MRIAAISDTHNCHDELTSLMPWADILVHSGDATLEGGLHEMIRFFNWLKKIKAIYRYLHIVYVPGNHDYLAQKSPFMVKEFAKDAGVECLIHEEITLLGLRIFGSPYTPKFFDWAFMKERGDEIKKMWDQIPEGIDVLITHGPAYGVLDKIDVRKPIPKYDLYHTMPGKDPVWDEHVGCYDLKMAIERIKPKAHFCGHIHPAYGKEMLGETICVNSSYLNSNGDEREPIVVDL